MKLNLVLAAIAVPLSSFLNYELVSIRFFGMVNSIKFGTVSRLTDQIIKNLDYTVDSHVLYECIK